MEPEEGENPIIVSVDRKTKMKHTNVIKTKGEQDHYAIERMAQDFLQVGYGHFVFKSDQQPAILSLKEAVTRRTTAVKREGLRLCLKCCQ